MKISAIHHIRVDGRDRQLRQLPDSRHDIIRVVCLVVVASRSRHGGDVRIDPGVGKRAGYCHGSRGARCESVADVPDKIRAFVFHDKTTDRSDAGFDDDRPRINALWQIVLHFDPVGRYRPDI